MTAPDPFDVPPATEWTSIVCGQCLGEGRAQRTWLDSRSLRMTCPTHGFILTVQAVEDRAEWE